MAAFQERLEGLRLRGGNGNHSQVGETEPSTGTDLTNRLLVELLQQQGEQLQLQNENL